MKCPGQDTRYWKPGDIFDVPCPACGSSVEFFKDESKRRCPSCGYQLGNPRLDLGCADWCPYGKKCLKAAGMEVPGEGDGEGDGETDPTPRPHEDSTETHAHS